MPPGLVLPLCIVTLAGLIVGGFYLVSLGGRKAMQRENQKLREQLAEVLRERKN